ncbi:MAG: hypothetical protein ACTSYB_03000 [Candidatus Helarchaeota archaeon]
MQNVKEDKYWFSEDNLLKPIDWEYLNTLPNKVQDTLELYMRGKISIGKAAEVAHLSFREFDKIRAKARIPVHFEG